MITFFLPFLSGIGGMNMTHGFEEHPFAFYATCCAMGLGTSALFTILYGRYRLLDSDTSEARMRHYYALKNYLNVLDEVEARLKIQSKKQQQNVDDSKNNYVTKEEFGNVLQSVINAQPDEIDLIFKSFDANRSGVLEINELDEHFDEESPYSASFKEKFSEQGQSQRKRQNLFFKRLKNYKKKQL